MEKEIITSGFLGGTHVFLSFIKDDCSKLAINEIGIKNVNQIIFDGLEELSFLFSELTKIHDIIVNTKLIKHYEANRKRISLVWDNSRLAIFAGDVKVNIIGTRRDQNPGFDSIADIIETIFKLIEVFITFQLQYRMETWSISSIQDIVTLFQKTLNEDKTNGSWISIIPPLVLRSGLQNSGLSKGLVCWERPNSKWIGLYDTRSHFTLPTWVTPNVFLNWIKRVLNKEQFIDNVTNHSSNEQITFVSNIEDVWNGMEMVPGAVVSIYTNTKYDFSKISISGDSVTFELLQDLYKTIQK